MMLLAGCIARIVTGGHWPSQVLASPLFAGILVWSLRELLGPDGKDA